MKFRILLLGAMLLTNVTTQAAAPPAASGREVAENQRMERELQRLNWKQFRSVVEAIPKLRAEIEAYGPAGWQYVRAKYATHPWHKHIDRLDAAEKQQLARLIQKAKALR